ncbi:hypothetical protein LY78DRAFT_664625 [Colletotrichum sublineola]|nr:hypothetical protein LY78DRAFT_664625 [Colletotrichum sublineola]
MPTMDALLSTYGEAARTRSCVSLASNWREKKLLVRAERRRSRSCAKLFFKPSWRCFYREPCKAAPLPAIVVLLCVKSPRGQLIGAGQFPGLLVQYAKTCPQIPAEYAKTNMFPSVVFVRANYLTVLGRGGEGVPEWPIPAAPHSIVNKGRRGLWLHLCISDPVLHARPGRERVRKASNPGFVAQFESSF